MRYFLSITLVLATILSTYSNDIEVEGLCYNVDVVNSTLSFCGVTSSYSKNEVTIPSSVTYNSRTLPVVSISTGAFTAWDKIKTVTIPSSVTIINPAAFQYGTKVEKVVIEDSDNPILMGYAYEGPLTTTRQEEGKGTFGYCNLKEVYIGRNLDFSDYNSLKFGYTPFYRNTVEKVTFSEKVTLIQPFLFWNCPNMKELKLSNSILEIGSQAFSNSEITNKFVLPPKITVVKHMTFLNSKFEIIDLSSEALTEIEESAFEGRSNYGYYSGDYSKEIILGKNVSKIGRYAFAQQKDIRKIICYNPDPPSFTFSSSNDVFVPNNVYLDATLYVPIGTIDAYKSAEVWKLFWNISELEDDSSIDSIEDNVKKTIEGIYDLSGKRHFDLIKGINIIKYSNGDVTKVVR